MDVITQKKTIVTKMTELSYKIEKERDFMALKPLLEEFLKLNDQYKILNKEP